MTWEQAIAVLAILAPAVRSMVELSRIRRDLDRLVAHMDALDTTLHAHSTDLGVVEEKVRHLETAVGMR